MMNKKKIAFILERCLLFFLVFITIYLWIAGNNLYISFDKHAMWTDTRLTCFCFQKNTSTTWTTTRLSILNFLSHYANILERPLPI